MATSSNFCRSTVCVIFLITIINATPSMGIDTKVIQTSFGKLKGRVVHFRHLGLPSVEQYLGVPYGTAPTASKRFMMPQTAAKWTNVIRDATQLPPACVQLWPASVTQRSRSEALKMVNERVQAQVKRLLAMLRNQSEDCLYMNLYVPSRRETEPSTMPVLVIVHGDSYNWNSGNLYDGSVLAAYGRTIVVTINYRLGVFGFLSSADPVCKGNWALSDIVCALDVLRAMVSDFGGDSNAITLLGWDTGAAMVNLLMASPISAPIESRLFRRAILLGGSALSPWATVNNAAEYFYQLAEGIGCRLYKQNQFGQQSLANVEEVLECVQSETVENITRAAALLSLPTFLANFGPVVDGIVVNSDPTHNLENHGSLFQEVDLLVGSTKHEAYDQMSGENLQFGLDSKRRDAVYRTFVRNQYSFHRREIFNAISNEYNDWYNPGQHPITVRDSVLEAIGDSLYLAPMIKMARLHAAGKISGAAQEPGAGQRRGRTYFYLFAHETSGNPRYGLKGSVHGEDLPYLLGYPMLNNQAPSIELNAFDFTFNRQERAMSEVLMRYVTNFVRTGDPNEAQWDKTITDDVKFFDKFRKFHWPEFYATTKETCLIINDSPKLEYFYRAHEVAFWNNLLPSLEATGRSESNPEHHLLNHHFVKSTYFGVVKAYDAGRVPFPPPPMPPTPMPAELTPKLQSQKLPVAKPSTEPPSPSSSNVDKQQTTNYSTILSVTIAVGCALLILNLLVFAGIYRQKERYRKVKRQENSSGLLLHDASPYDMTSSYGGMVASNSGQYSTGGTMIPMQGAYATPSSMGMTRDGDLYPYAPHMGPTNAYVASPGGQMIISPEDETVISQQANQMTNTICPRHGKVTTSPEQNMPQQLEEIQV